MPMTDPRRLAVVAAAVSQIGPGDTPRYWASCGIKPAPKPGEKGGEWCGAFALWCLHQAGVALSIPWIIGLGFCAVRGRELALTKNPQPGDIMYLDKPWQHHGVVESFVNGVLTTIEGNTPTVQRRVRQTVPAGMVFYSIQRFLDGTAVAPVPDKPKPTPQPKPYVPPAVSDLIRGVDVSHHQLPKAVNWVKLAETHKFVYVRATYGTEVDETCAEHVTRARDAGLQVGLYSFFRPGAGADEQLAAFGDVHENLAPTLAPALDVEQNPKYDGKVSPERYAPAEQVARGMLTRWGRALLYTNHAMSVELDNPAWFKNLELWVANYGVKTPKTPLGLSWLIWQHLVAPLPGVYSRDIDQNLATALPLLRSLSEADTDPAPPMLPVDVDWDELVRARDEWVKDH